MNGERMSLSEINIGILEREIRQQEKKKQSEDWKLLEKCIVLDRKSRQNLLQVDGGAGEDAERERERRQ